MGSTGLAHGRPVILAAIGGAIIVIVVVRMIRGRMTGRRGFIGLIVAAAVLAYIVIREFVIK